MTKIVRLKESDIENLVKKIIKEDKNYINEVSVDKIVSKIKSKGGKVEPTDEEKLMTYVKNKIKKGKECDIRVTNKGFNVVKGSERKRIFDFDQIGNMVKYINESEKIGSRYMFFSNLEQMHRQTAMLLEMDRDMLEQILEGGHDWAQDHIAEAKNNMDQVFDFLMNEVKGSEHESHMDEYGLPYDEESDLTDIHPTGTSEWKSKKMAENRKLLNQLLLIKEEPQQLDEGIKDITAGVLIALSSLLGGKSIAQEIAPINNFQQPKSSELKIAQSLKQSLENESKHKQVDTLINTAVGEIAGEDTKGDFKQLIHTKYYNDQGEWIGQVMQQKSRTDGVDQEKFHNYSKSSGGEFINLDDKSIEDAVATSKTEVKELQNELDQFLENFKSDVKAGKVSGVELGLNYRGKIQQLENKIEKLQKKYPQLKFNGMNYSRYNEFKSNYGDGRLVDVLNSLENNKSGDYRYGIDAKLSFQDDWGGESDLGYTLK